MSTREESWARLAAAAWLSDGTVSRAMADAGATPQALSGGAYSTIADEYKIIATRMPPSVSPEAVVEGFADSPNGAVRSGMFNTINVFRRRSPGTPPRVGEIYDIDLVGPDNGAVMIVRLSEGFGEPRSRPDTWFDVQAIETPEHGTLPEYGAREFGFEREAGGGIAFYTRGVSRARDILVGVFGKVPQQLGWRAAFGGLRDVLRSQGGEVGAEVVRNFRVTPGG